MKVSGFKTRGGNIAANQYIIKEGSKLTFQSYDSVIAIIEHSSTANPIVTLDRNMWDYSVTTGRYRNQFLNEGIEETRKKIASGEYMLADLN